LRKIMISNGISINVNQKMDKLASVSLAGVLVQKFSGLPNELKKDDLKIRYRLDICYLIKSMNGKRV